MYIIQVIYFFIGLWFGLEAKDVVDHTSITSLTTRTHDGIGVNRQASSMKMIASTQTALTLETTIDDIVYTFTSTYTQTFPSRTQSHIVSSGSIGLRVSYYETPLNNSNRAFQCIPIWWLYFVGCLIVSWILV